jgi:acyl-CoA reductase-like NAD-dependent aldehyde dehydrogenase
MPDGTLVTCEHCAFPHPKGDDGRPCLFPKVAVPSVGSPPVPGEAEAPDVEALVEAFGRAFTDYRTTGQAPERERYDAARDRLLTHVRSIRRRAHEEAARLVENMGDCAACDLAAEIRSLSEREEGTSNG